MRDGYVERTAFFARRCTGGLRARTAPDGGATGMRGRGARALGRSNDRNGPYGEERVLARPRLHRLEQADQPLALFGRLVLHTWGDLVVLPPDQEPGLHESSQPARECLGGEAQPLLSLAEPNAPVGGIEEKVQDVQHVRLCKKGKERANIAAARPTWRGLSGSRLRRSALC